MNSIPSARRVISSTLIVLALGGALTACSTEKKEEPLTSTVPSTSAPSETSSSAPVENTPTEGEMTPAETTEAPSSTGAGHSVNDPAPFGTPITASKAVITLGEPTKGKPTDFSKGFTQKYPEMDTYLVVPVTVQNSSTEPMSLFGSLSGRVGNDRTISTDSDPVNGIKPFTGQLAPGKTGTFKVGVMVSSSKPYVLAYSPLFVESSEVPLFWGAK